MNYSYFRVALLNRLIKQLTMILIFGTPFKQIKIPRLISIIQITFVASCTIIPDDAIDYIPSSARIKSFTIDRYIGESSTSSGTYKASVTYKGTFDNPSQIEITWPTGMQPARIPTFDKTNKITKTIYKLSNWKVTEITNINSQNKTARIETFSYAGEQIKQLIQTNYNNGLVVNTYTNDFFYKNAAIDSVYQKLCTANGSCLVGFFVYNLFERNGNNNINIYDGCSGGTFIGNADCFGIMYYDPNQPYSYDYGALQTYYDEATQSYYYSQNNFTKTHYNLTAIEDDTNPFNSKLLSITSVYKSINDCYAVLLDTEIDPSYSSPSYAYGFVSNIEISFANSYDQYFTPIYYYILQRADVKENQAAPLIQSANLFPALTRFYDIVYYSDAAGSFLEDDNILYRINYELEISGK